MLGFVSGSQSHPTDLCVYPAEMRGRVGASRTEQESAQSLAVRTVVAVGSSKMHFIKSSELPAPPGPLSLLLSLFCIY